MRVVMERIPASDGWLGVSVVRKQTLDDLEVDGRRVLVRVDFNVPLQNGGVADDTRIRAAIPTIHRLLERGAAVILCSHLGRPDGEVRDGLRLTQVGKRLQDLLRITVHFAADCVGREVQAQANALKSGEVLLLENLRFHKEEEVNNARFAERLAKLADCYVNDAFGAAHRANASTEGVARFLPSAAGLLMAREIEYLGNVFEHGAHVAVVSGGAKVSDKLGLLHVLVAKASVLCIGGAMANTFLQACGVAIGASLAEPEMVTEAQEVLAQAEQHGCRVILPVDGVIAERPSQPPRARPVLFEEESVPDGWQILDVGPLTIEVYLQALQNIDTVIWNGPLGLFERVAFSGGTRSLAQRLAEMETRVVVCGGETVQAVTEAGVAKQMAHVSTGGGAALELLEGRDLPGVAALPDAKNASVR